MRWIDCSPADVEALAIANRHYNRQTPDSPQFAPPGRKLVLKLAPSSPPAPSPRGSAFWVSTWQKYVKHAWPGAWVCTAFRNESADLSSDLIRQAVAATRHKWPRVPDLGMVTFIDPSKVRRKRDPGRCFLRAGFRLIACTLGHSRRTGGSLLVFQLLPADMPAPSPALGVQLDLGASFDGKTGSRHIGA